MSFYVTPPNSTTEIFRSIEQAYPNTFFSVEELMGNTTNYNIFVKFKVGPNYRYILHPLDRSEFMEYDYFRLLVKHVNKLLDAKETVRICTKFWTGVEIV